MDLRQSRPGARGKRVKIPAVIELGGLFLADPLLLAGQFRGIGDPQLVFQSHCTRSFLKQTSFPAWIS